jgi:hypothetical protein
MLHNMARSSKHRAEDKESDRPLVKMVTQMLADYRAKRKHKYHCKRDVGRQCYTRRGGEAVAGAAVIDRELRHAFSYGLMRDLDIENAHPSMCEQVCESISLDTPFLSRDIGDRDGVRQMLMDTYDFTREDSKLTVIKLIYGGMLKYNGQALTDEFCVGLAAEMATIADAISCTPPS